VYCTLAMGFRARDRVEKQGMEPCLFEKIFLGDDTFLEARFEGGTGVARDLTTSLGIGFGGRDRLDNTKDPFCVGTISFA